MNNTDWLYGKEPKTSGDFATEEDACDTFDDAMEEHASGLFRVYKECQGWYMHGKVGAKETQCRIDRILIPTAACKEKWGFGAIGVEIKKSGVKVGRVACQCIDYRSAVFEVENCMIHLNQVFVFPLVSFGNGAIQSVVCNYRVGACNLSPQHKVSFSFAATPVLEVSRCRVICNNNHVAEKVGNKRGSRKAQSA